VSLEGYEDGDKWVQATLDCAFLFVLSQVPGTPERN
jgi:hypothetical protein